MSVKIKQYLNLSSAGMKALLRINKLGNKMTAFSQKSQRMKRVRKDRVNLLFITHNFLQTYTPGFPTHFCVSFSLLVNS